MNFANIQGHISVERKILNWEWWDHLPTRNVFFVCLLLANHKDFRYQGKVIKRGQFWTSLDVLSDISGFSIRSVRTALAHLVSTSEITDESTKGGRMITVCNYDVYQKINRFTDKQSDNRTDNQPTDDRQMPDRQPTTNNNDNNDNNDNKTIEEKNIKKSTEKNFYEESEIAEILLAQGIILKPRFLKNFVKYNNKLGWTMEPTVAIEKYKFTNPMCLDKGKMKALEKPRERVAPERETEARAAAQKWDTIRAHLRDHISGSDFSTWIEPIRPVAVIGDSIHIQVPSRFFYEHIESNFVADFQKAVYAAGLRKLEYRLPNQTHTT